MNIFTCTNNRVSDRMFIWTGDPGSVLDSASVFGVCPVRPLRQTVRAPEKRLEDFPWSTWSHARKPLFDPCRVPVAPSRGSPTPDPAPAALVPGPHHQRHDLRPFRDLAPHRHHQRKPLRRPRARAAGESNLLAVPVFCIFNFEYSFPV